jgi:hypothetical protein
LGVVEGWVAAVRGVVFGVAIVEAVGHDEVHDFLGPWSCGGE